ncbi:hypothetical protein FHS18_005667 [Paenibacillus phyllosphaerae]|uniref:Uncharacterized protein n=1 Tax=Paenibacillus phyllosphaerae TaxID=274593 RepID=A0A7W5B344_9BACL|nr:hypothetical protein [Paenibacillus phyllosphaerae]
MRKKVPGMLVNQTSYARLFVFLKGTLLGNLI